jgi:hypothetical protein
MRSLRSPMDVQSPTSSNKREPSKSDNEADDAVGEANFDLPASAHVGRAAPTTHRDDSTSNQKEADEQQDEADGALIDSNQRTCNVFETAGWFPPSPRAPTTRWRPSEGSQHPRCPTRG